MCLIDLIKHHGYSNHQKSLTKAVYRFCLSRHFSFSRQNQDHLISSMKRVTNQPDYKAWLSAIHQLFSAEQLQMDDFQIVDICHDFRSVGDVIAYLSTTDLRTLWTATAPTPDREAARRRREAAAKRRRERIAEQQKQEKTPAKAPEPKPRAPPVFVKPVVHTTWADLRLSTEPKENVSVCHFPEPKAKQNPPAPAKPKENPFVWHSPESEPKQNPPAQAKPKENPFVWHCPEFEPKQNPPAQGKPKENPVVLHSPESEPKQNPPAQAKPKENPFVWHCPESAQAASASAETSFASRPVLSVSDEVGFAIPENAEIAPPAELPVPYYPHYDAYPPVLPYGFWVFPAQFGLAK
jgi:hypothetical protein